MERQISIHRPVPTEVNISAFSPLLKGHMNNLPPVNSKIVRVFVSSTFSDTIHERNILMEKAYPKLKEYCRKEHGLEFQMVDLRWGIREESQDDHTTIDFCLQEIENCRKTSIGPNFVLFLGQKYGYRPFPPNIQADEFMTLRRQLIDDGRSVGILDAWFQRDQNVIPPVYNLMAISSVLVHYNDKDDHVKHKNPTLMDIDREKWSHVFQEILNLLRYAANKCFALNLITKRQRDKYFVSVTEYEIDKGLVQCENKDRDCVVFMRNIQNLRENLEKGRIQGFIDLKPGLREVDEEAQELLRTLKESKLPDSLPSPTNTAKFELEWKRPEVTVPTEDKLYLQGFCDTFVTRMQQVICRSARKIGNLVSDPYMIEVIQHLMTCKTRAGVCRGREPIVRNIRRYVAGTSNQLMVVHGESGSGKTSVMAKASSLIRSWFTESDPVVIIRFLGTTSHSCSVRLVLASMCWQIAAIYGRDVTAIPGDYPSLVSYFHMVLQFAKASHPLVIILDSLDQLLTTHQAHSLVWLPKQLPEHVRIVVSTLPHEYNLLESLKDKVSNTTNFVEVTPLGPDVSMELLQEWLHDSKRNLSRKQSVVVQEALKNCNLPLYTKLTFEEVCQWRSYQPLSHTTLEFCIQGIINTLFDRLEKYYGATFVKHALSYLTASKNGLSDTELEDLLSLDDMVLNDVFIHWLPPIRRIPPQLWPRLYHQLSSYITQREANGVIVFYWYHRQFISVVEKRYLVNNKHKRYIHSSLADYFRGEWGGGVKKPFSYSTDQVKFLDLKETIGKEDRKVPLQPLVLAEPPKSSKVRYNLRMLSELPDHLIASGRFQNLREEVFFSYEWLHTKLKAMTLHDLLSDFRSYSETDAGIKDEEVGLLGSAVRFGGSHVNQNPDTLGFDLTGRLLPYYDQYKNIRQLIQECDTVALKHSALVPLFQCYESPRHMLHAILEDHSKVVYDLLFSKSTKELISVSKDKTIAFWDVTSGEKTRSIDITDLDPGPQTKLLQSSDGKYLVCDSDTLNSPVHIYDLKSAQLVHQVGCRLPTQRRVFTAGNILCRQKNIIDLKTGNTIKTLDDFVPTKKYVTCAISPNERYIVIGLDESTQLFNLRSGKLQASFSSKHQVSTCVFNEDSTKLFLGYTQDCLLRVCDVDPLSNKFGSSLLQYDYQTVFPKLTLLDGPPHGRELAEIAVSVEKPDLILLNIRRANLVVLNIKTRQSKLLDMNAIGANNKTFLFGAKFSKERQYIIAAEGHFLHIWSSETCRLHSTVALHSVFQYPIAVSEQFNYVATASTIHTAIKIWNLNKVDSSEQNQLQIYESPIDMVSVSPHKRLLYVKHCHSLSSGLGFKYHDRFGIDVWNLNTGKSQVFLPFAQYGRPLQMQVTLDGMQMALLLANRDETYVTVMKMMTHQTLLFGHQDCISFQMSLNGEYVVTLAERGDGLEMKLWSTIKGTQLLVFGNVASPIFTYDSAHLLFVQGGHTLHAYSLDKLDMVNSIHYGGDKLQSIPNQPHLVLVTKYTRGLLDKRHETHVSVLNFRKQKLVRNLTGIAPIGILDMSKDGQLAVDGYLQVYDLLRDRPMFPLALATGVAEKEYNYVKMTYDGKYVIWIDELTVKACRRSDGKIIGNISTHEKPTCLELTDAGYLIAIGREDGHLFTVRLVDNDGTKETVQAKDYQGRISELLNKRGCSPSALAEFDPVFQQYPLALKDTQLLCASKDMQDMLLNRAMVYATQISMPGSPGDNRRDKTPKDRRSSSPLNLRGFFDGRKTSRDSSPHPMSKDKNSPKSNLKKKCRSVHDLFSLTNSSRAIHEVGIMTMTLLDSKSKQNRQGSGKRRSTPLFIPDTHMDLLGNGIGGSDPELVRNRTPSV